LASIQLTESTTSVVLGMLEYSVATYIDILILFILICEVCMRHSPQAWRGESGKGQTRTNIWQDSLAMPQHICQPAPPYTNIALVSYHPTCGRWAPTGYNAEGGTVLNLVLEGNWTLGQCENLASRDADTPIPIPSPLSTLLEPGPEFVCGVLFYNRGHGDPEIQNSRDRESKSLGGLIRMPD
jgi:hypothetical protein